MAIFLTMNVRADNVANLISDLSSLPDRIIDDTEQIMVDEADDTKSRIQSQHFGAFTGPPRFGGSLMSRSGKAVSSIDFKERRTKNRVAVNIGALNATAKTKQYFETQEIGRTIKPVRSYKLAFPLGDATWPTRDASGVQILTLRKLLQDPERWGYDFIMWKPKSVLGHRIGGMPGVFDFLFARRRKVKIPRRAPVGSEMGEMGKNIFDRIKQLQI